MKKGRKGIDQQYVLFLLLLLVSTADSFNGTPSRSRLLRAVS